MARGIGWSRRSRPTRALRHSAPRRESDEGSRAATTDNSEKEARRQERQRQYEERVSARARNLDLGAALAKWQPKLDADAVKLLGSIVLHQYSKAAAWAHRLCVEQASTENKQGEVTVHYPRGAEAERKLHAEGTTRSIAPVLPRTRSPSFLRLLMAQRLVDTAGLPNADRQGVYEPQELAASPMLEKLARRIAPASVKLHLAAREVGRERREQAWRDERAAKLHQQRNKLAAGESVRCECCFRPIESAAEATEKHGARAGRWIRSRSLLCGRSAWVKVSN